MLADLVVGQHTAVVIHLFLAEPDLLDKHGQEGAEAEVQLLIFLDLLEATLIDFWYIDTV